MTAGKVVLETSLKKINLDLKGKFRVEKLIEIFILEKRVKIKKNEQDI